MENNKKRIYAVIAIGVLLLLLIGSTFAYFAAQGGDASQTDVNILTHTVDSLVFETGDALSITADQNTFAQGKGNQTDSTFARATLKANSSTNTATDHYYVYLSIDENTFEYTTTEKTAELILTINKVEGETKTPVTTIDGLNYVTVGSVSGFDVTDYNNLVMIANNYEITSNGTKIDEWEVTLTLVNLDSNQSVNAGKIFNAQLLIQKQPVASQYIASLFTTQGANHLYHHDGTLKDAEGNIMDAEDGSYRYVGGDYKVAEAYKSQYNTISDILKLKIEDQWLAKFSLSYKNDETFYDHKQAFNTALADGYIEEDTVNNYICFGSKANECPHDNLYRIIGVFDNNLKLIKADYATEDQLGTDGDFKETVSYTNVEFSDEEKYLEYLYFKPYSNLEKRSYYYWNTENKNLANLETGNYNVWSYSSLNKTNLNKNFLNKLGNEWSNKIKETTWYVGGINLSDEQISINEKSIYEYELGKKKVVSSPFEPYNAKVGLMYISDFYYSANFNYWNKEYYNEEVMICYNENCYLYFYKLSLSIEENWMFLGAFEFEHTISRHQGNNDYYYDLQQIGMVDTSGIKNGSSGPVRPTFYLKSSVTFAGGTGTSTDPYRIA